MTTSAQQNLFDRIAVLLPEEQREHYYRCMAHFHKLNPNDELLLIFEAIGFLALIIRQTPEKIAGQQTEIERLLANAIQALQEAQQKAVDFVRTVEGRIEKLPAAIATSLDSTAIALRIGEGIQQSLTDIALPQTANGLRDTATTLQAALHDFSAVTAYLDDPKQGVIVRLHKTFRAMEEQIAETTGLANKQLRRLHWHLLAGVGLLCLACILVGFVLGVLVIHAVPPEPSGQSIHQQREVTPSTKPATTTPRKKAARQEN